MSRQNIDAYAVHPGLRRALRYLCMPAVLACSACTMTPVDPVAFVIMREATPPPGYQAAIEANRITPLFVQEGPSLGPLPMGGPGSPGASAVNAMPLGVVPTR